MFQFPGFAPIARYYTFSIVGCPIRKSTTKRSFAPNRSLSQLVTSFIASQSQGIRHTPLVTFLLILILLSVIDININDGSNFYNYIVFSFKMSKNLFRLIIKSN